MPQRKEITPITPGKAITTVGVLFFFMHLLALFCGMLNNFDFIDFHVVARTFVCLIAIIIIGLILLRYERSNKIQIRIKERKNVD